MTRMILLLLAAGLVVTVAYEHMDEPSMDEAAELM